MKTLSVLVAVGVVAFVGAWALWGYHWDGYAPVVVRAQVVDATSGQPIPDATLVAVYSEKLLENREEFERAVASTLRRDPSRIDDGFGLLREVHASRADSNGRVEVVASTRTSGIGIGSWQVTKRFNQSRPARASLRAPGHVEKVVDVRSFLSGPVSGADEIEHLVADLGVVKLARAVPK